MAAALALLLYVAAMLCFLNGLDVTLTLPGIAGIILSVGMAVDANVIIFTRIREEIAAGKNVREAIKIGFGKALSAVIDGNITTLIAAAVLYLKGTGTIKGFRHYTGPWYCAFYVYSPRYYTIRADGIIWYWILKMSNSMVSEGSKG